MNETASIAMPRSRLACEWRAFVELWWWPLLIALLPYRWGIAAARFLARRHTLYEEAAQAAAAQWRAVQPGSDERDWLTRFRFTRLIDHADLFWALTRSDEFLLNHMQREPLRGLGNNPLLIVSFHYGQGLWLMRWLRAGGVRPRFLSVRSERDSADSMLMYVYALLRIRVVERLAGAAPIFLGGAKRAISDALSDGQAVYALVDVPVPGAGAQDGNCEVFGRQLVFPTGVLEAASGSRAAAVVMTCRMRTDGQRDLDIEVVERADMLDIRALASRLETRMRTDSAAWHFWNIWGAFRARNDADR